MASDGRVDAPHESSRVGPGDPSIPVVANNPGAASRCDLGASTPRAIRPEPGGGEPATLEDSRVPVIERDGLARVPDGRTVSSARESPL
mmetsp:Transcript_4804/g.17998  ORF Transcript_4804/g.17998 Transcript_4804/m.17998 type:complete len:89 (-) Transcript_4804:33-299(-)